MNAQLKPRVYAERTYDVDLIKSIMMQVVDEVQEDGFVQEEWIPDLHRNIWVVIGYAGNVLGLYLLKQVGAITCELHINLLKHSRKQRHHIGLVAMIWFLENTNINKLITEIPTAFPHIKRHAKNMGFTYEGTNRESFLKDGVICDKDLYGITRKEIQQFIIKSGGSYG